MGMNLRKGTLRWLLWHTFLAGFKASAEGWNGEILFDGKSDTPTVKDWGYLQQQFRNYEREMNK